MNVKRLKEGRLFLEWAIEKFKKEKFSVRPLLEYKKNIEQHIDNDTPAPFEKLKKLSQERVLNRLLEIQQVESKTVLENIAYYCDYGAKDTKEDFISLTKQEEIEVLEMYLEVLKNGR